MIESFVIGLVKALLGILLALVVLFALFVIWIVRNVHAGRKADHG